MSTPLPCPCGHPRPYAQCCGLLHTGARAAATAEELMRSRYAAYSLGKVDYLVQTLHPTQRQTLDRQSLARSARRLRWTGLTVLETRGGSVIDTTGMVAFEARYLEGKAPGVLAERSRFTRHEGRWVYVDGEGL